MVVDGLSGSAQGASGTRAGVRLLTMASSSIKREILRALYEQPLALGGGHAARITPNGREMLYIAFLAERWLQSAPGGSLDYESGEAEAAIASLAEGWGSTAIHALSREPMTLAELKRVVTRVPGQALERRLLAMRRSSLVTLEPGDEETGRYAVTDWLREGVAPLAAAARLERRDPKEGMEPIDELDVEAAFLLTLPLLELPTELAGRVRLAVEIGEEGAPHGLAGVTARVEGGRVAACERQLDESAETWAQASAGDWLDTLIEPDAKRVRTAGDRVLPAVLLGGLHEVLFGVRVRKTAG